MSWCRDHSGTCGKILLPVGTLLSECWGPVSVGHPLVREDRSAVFSKIIQFCASRITIDWFTHTNSRDRIFFFFQIFATCSCRNVAVWMLRSCSVGHPLWREDRSAVFSKIIQWSEMRRTRNYTLLSHLRFPEPGRTGCRIYRLSPRNKLAQLYPWALDSFYVGSYDSQAYGGGILTRSHTVVHWWRSYVYTTWCSLLFPFRSYIRGATEAVLSSAKSKLTPIMLSYSGLEICDRRTSIETSAPVKQRFSSAMPNFQGAPRFLICTYHFKFQTCTIT
jgi:hypothetical protein